MYRQHAEFGWIHNVGPMPCLYWRWSWIVVVSDVHMHVPFWIAVVRGHVNYSKGIISQIVFQRARMSAFVGHWGRWTRADIRFRPEVKIWRFCACAVKKCPKSSLHAASRRFFATTRLSCLYVNLNIFYFSEILCTNVTSLQPCSRADMVELCSIFSSRLSYWSCNHLRQVWFTPNEYRDWRYNNGVRASLFIILTASDQ